VVVVMMMMMLAPGWGRGSPLQRPIHVADETAGMSERLNASTPQGFKRDAWILECLEATPSRDVDVRGCAWVAWVLRGCEDAQMLLHRYDPHPIWDKLILCKHYSMGTDWMADGFMGKVGDLQTIYLPDH